ncbi:MAG: DUF3179 domain-containing protein [Acidimicrobiia bacterium]|nr:DUF3179 domain-containing protein [Acidimicrobiia bacterium]MDH4306652.1 DUF3179 domain-containing protein [Acidimicrobiia bacterium]MDH5295060.1 DUF3179 domain-containing protein [Acidimicrobiia bacterium]
MSKLAATVALVMGVTACSAASVADTTAPSTTGEPGIITETSSSNTAVEGVPDELASVSAAWNTDFTQATIDLAELHVGIPAADPRDLIRPIDSPAFESVEAGSAWLQATDPGAVVELDGNARFYPLSIMTRHEIVNDSFGDRPVIVTYCPLCNTAIAFDPEVNGETLRFGVSGLLRQSDLVMWDDTTESLWQQITGEAIVGELAGTRLDPIPSAILSWADFAERHPTGQALAFDQGFGVQYGANPYVGYSSRAAPIPSFFDGEIDTRYPALSRVVGVTMEEASKAYPFEPLSAARVVNDEVGGEPIVVLWGAPDTADALDTSVIANGQQVGTGVAYFATVDGRELTFEHSADDLFTDTETGSTWTLLGDAIEGPLAGERLEIAPHRNEFWFAFQAFFGDAPVWEG